MLLRQNMHSHPQKIVLLLITTHDYTPGPKMLSEQLRKIRSDIHCNGDAGMGSRMILSIKEPQA